MRRVTTRALVVTGLLVTLLLAGVASFYASSHPDGLNYVAEKVGFSDTAKRHAGDDSPLSGYATRGVSDQRLSRGVAGVVGVVVVGLLFGGLTWALRRRRSEEDSPGGDEDRSDGSLPDVRSSGAPGRERDGSTSRGR
jgi:hypothetical protein